MPYARPSRLALMLIVLASLVAPGAHAAISRPGRAGGGYPALLARPDAWPQGTVAAIGSVRSRATPLESAGNILALYFDAGDDLTFRVSLVAPLGIADGVDHVARGRVRVLVLVDEGAGGNHELPAPLRGPSPIAWDRMLLLDPAGPVPARVAAGARSAAVALEPGRAAFHLDHGWMAAALPRVEGAAPRRAAVITFSGERELDRLVAPLGAERATTYEANVAFMHFGNQGLSYSDVFHGRAGAEGSSGFDEMLRVHELKNVPANVHLSPLLQSSAEWDARNGDPQDFNAWMRTGVTSGWLGIIASAYGQPILPFLQGAMNDWAVDRDVAMQSWRYGYTPHVAWVPERVWLTPSQYPGNGVIDASSSHWQAHGINGVILDDWPHLQGHDNHQIHTLSGTGLRLIPRDADFTGKMHAGDGAGALAVLTGLAGSGLGTYRLVSYADDWEMAAEMGNWATDFPFALDTYLWMIDKCQTESAWLHTWKLDPALGNANFNGDTFTPTHGTYGTIGGADGYGGSNNAWYGDWAGYIPYSTGGNGSGGCGGTGNCKNHGTLWNDAHAALQAAPNNNIREAGWYVLMTNLHETGWHDYLGGPISGWERQYSAHIKNANVYAEAARWAGGLYASPTGAFFTDVDNDGVNELVMYNDRVLAAFESIGGRAPWIFAKSGGTNYSVVGIDDAYWYGTEGDYNDGNHIAALSDVGPNYQHDFYGMAVDTASGNTVQATFTHSGVKKTIRLTLGQPYLDCIYRVGANHQYIQSGWSPDLVDLLYNARMDRIWAPDVSYMGRRNPNTAATGAYVIGGGGAQFQMEIGGTLMKGDEIHGTQKFEFYVYAGPTSAPDGGGNVAELAALSAGLTDGLAPKAVSGTYFPATRQLALTFDEPVRYDEVVATKISMDSDDDGVPDATLDGGTTVLNGANAAVLTLQVSSAVHAAIQALDHNQMRLLLQAGAVKDVPGNPNVALTNAGDVFVSYGPPTLITLDGDFNPSEWPSCTIAVADSFDSGWNSPGNTDNEIQAVYAQWDSTYLYLGIRGEATANSWLLYLDTDPGGPNGQTDLTAIDAWERGAQFTASGFKADWQFGAYQHQGIYDSQSFFRITSPTTTADSTAAILKAFDPMHTFGLSGGSEIAIPWSTLYGLGPGRVPANCQLGLVSSLCWDPEPAGELGGDQAPNNLAATPPTLDNRTLIAIDANGDGYPDLIDRTPPSLASAAYTGWDSVISLQFSEPVTAATANQASRYSVFQTSNPAQSLTVRGATLQGDQISVLLLVSPMAYVGYTVVASGIADTSCFHNVANQTSTEFQGPPVAVDPTVAPPRALQLATPWPNPTTGRCAISYALPEAAGVALDLYDLGGRHVRSLVRSSQPAGQYRVAYDGLDDQGRRLASGMYFVRVSAGTRQQVKRLVVLP